MAMRVWRSSIQKATVNSISVERRNEAQGERTARHEEEDRHERERREEQETASKRVDRHHRCVKSVLASGARREGKWNGPGPANTKLSAPKPREAANADVSENPDAEKMVEL